MKVYYEFDLTNFNSYRVRAKCRSAYFPKNEEEVVDFVKDNNSFILLGSGHNIILSKEWYDVPFVIFNGNFNSITVDDYGGIEVEAGAMMCDVSHTALQHSLTGLEIFWDIPSTLGGAVVMNAGASGEEIKDVLTKVRYFDLKDKLIREMRKEDISFEYRNSFFQKNTDKIVLRAWLKLEKGVKDAIFHKMETIKAKRWEKQPKDLPNGGSVFKRPPGCYVGTMIEELGLKGLTVGGAMVSKKHGGFIVNVGGATGHDILKLISEIQQRVKSHYGLDLEIEQRII